MDTLSSHRVRGVGEAIEGVGGECLFLPPDRPDVHPIEPACATLKAWWRQVAACTVESLWQTVAEALDTFSPEQCANSFRNAGDRSY